MAKRVQITYWNDNGELCQIDEVANIDEKEWARISAFLQARADKCSVSFHPSSPTHDTPSDEPPKRVSTTRCPTRRAEDADLVAWEIAEELREQAKRIDNGDKGIADVDFNIC